MRAITLNEKFNHKTKNQVFFEMKDYDLKLELSRESGKCQDASVFLRFVTDIYIEVESFDDTSKDYEKSVLVKKMIGVLKVKDQLLRIIQSNRLYNSYLMYKNNFIEWNFNETNTKIERSHLRIVR